MKNEMAVQARPATLSIRWSTVAAVAVGVCFGMVIGAFGGQQAFKHNPLQFVVLPSDTSADICINGFAYEADEEDHDSPWHGVYRPVQQGQPPLITEDGQRALRQVAPVRCKIGVVKRTP